MEEMNIEGDSARVKFESAEGNKILTIISFDDYFITSFSLVESPPCNVMWK